MAPPETVRPGDRAACALRNRTETIELYRASQWIGAVFTPLNRRLRADEIAYCVADAEAAVLAVEGVSHELAPAELDAAVARLAEELASRPAVALRMAKRVIAIAQNAPLETALEVEGLAYGLLRETHDFAEGVAEFGEKRPPAFEDR